MTAFLRHAGRWVNNRAWLLLVATMTMWGGNVVAGKLAVGEVSPMALTFLRWVGVSLVLTLVARRDLTRDWAVLRPHWRRIAAMGALGFTAFNALFYAGAKFTTGVNIAIMQGSIPVFVLLAGALLYRAPIRPLQGVGLALTLVGVAVVATHGDIARLREVAFNFGDLLMLIACSLYAFYTLQLRFRPAVSPLSFFAGLAIAATLTSAPLVVAEMSQGATQWPTLKGWLIIVYVALGPSFLSQILFMRGVELIGPARAGLFANLVPVIGALLSVAILGEPFGLYHAAALALVLGGVWIAEAGAARRA